MNQERVEGDLRSEEGRKAVEALHAKYVSKLHELYEGHKHLWAHKGGSFRVL